jgi:hypothetical protein
MMQDKALKWALWAVAAVGAALLAAAVLSAEETPEKTAAKAATDWLALVDAGRYGESWSQASSLFRQQVTAEQWKTALTSVRQPLGALVSRKLVSARYTKSMPGAPDGEYVVIAFETVFENKKAAVETVTPVKEKDGSWKVSGYYIH